MHLLFRVLAVSIMIGLLIPLSLHAESGIDRLSPEALFSAHSALMEQNSMCLAVSTDTSLAMISQNPDSSMDASLERSAAVGSLSDDSPPQIKSDHLELSAEVGAGGKLESSGSSGTSSSADPAEGLVVLTEVLADPLGADTHEWIEIGNIGEISVDITGWKLRVEGISTVYAIGSMMLEPGAYHAFRRSVTGLQLRNDGATVQLLKASALVDSLVYPKTAEQVSFGRDPDDSESLRTLCTPTEGEPNEDREWPASLIIQSGTLTGEERVTLNLAVEVPGYSLEGVTCEIDFGDSALSHSCNPPSHTYTRVGTYEIHAHIKNYCSTTVERALSVEVFPEPSSSSSESSIVPSSSSRSSSSLSYVSSARSSSSSRFSSSRSSSSRSSSSRSSSSRSSVRSVSSVIAVPQPAASTSQIRIMLSGALPNPRGKDTGQEWVELWNLEAREITLEGWKLRIGTRVLGLPSMVLPGGGRKKVTNAEVSFTLKNENGSVELLDPDQNIVSTLSWSVAEEGVAYHPSPTAGSSMTAFVEEVLDGDTFKIRVEDPSITAEEHVSVRLLCIDAPETVHPTKKPESYGKEASEFLRALIVAKNIELQFDTNYRDRYDRLLAYATTADGSLMQRELLLRGFAKVDEAHACSKKEELLAVQRTAQQNGYGLWGGKALPSKLSFSSVGLSLDQSASDADSSYDVSARIIITEIFGHPQPGEEEWIELFNPTDRAQSLEGWILDDIVTGGSKPWKIPAGMVIEPHGYIVFSSQQSGLKVNDTGDEVSLMIPDGSVINAIKVPKLKIGQSFGRIMEGDRYMDDWCLTTSASRGSSSICIRPASGSVLKKTKTQNAKSKTKALAPKSSSGSDLWEEVDPELGFEEYEESSWTLGTMMKHGSVAALSALAGVASSVFFILKRRIV